jgi:hypothetical protein
LLDFFLFRYFRSVNANVERFGLVEAANSTKDILDFIPHSFSLSHGTNFTFMAQLKKSGDKEKGENEHDRVQKWYMTTQVMSRLDASMIPLTKTF